jgi:hypothetical protein
VILRNPERAIEILELTLNGTTLKECARKFNVSPQLCDQLTRRAVLYLRSFPYLSDEIMPEHNWMRAQQRQAHREFWLRQIQHARALNLCAPPRDELVAIAAEVGMPFGLSAANTLRLIQSYERRLLKVGRSAGQSQSTPSPAESVAQDGNPTSRQKAR